MSGRQLPFENVMIDDLAPGIISAAELQRSVSQRNRIEYATVAIEKLTRIANLFNHLGMLIFNRASCSKSDKFLMIG